jgi:hypothetical protein
VVVIAVEVVKGAAVALELILPPALPLLLLDLAEGQ